MDMDLRFWHQDGRLSIQDRAELIELRAEMDERERDFVDPDIIHLFSPEELAARNTLNGQWAILVKLTDALDAEFNRGHQKHWAYDISRHMRLKAMKEREHALIACQLEDA